MKSPSLQDALSLVSQLSPNDQRALLKTLQDRLAAPDNETWALEGAQLAFMLQHRDRIESAYQADDMASLDALEASSEYKTLFGDMPWDEAYDRFEETWWGEGD